MFFVLPSSSASREDISLLQSRMFGLEEQLSDQSEQLRQLTTLLQQTLQASRLHPRTAFHRPPSSPQIEIQELHNRRDSDI